MSKSVGRPVKGKTSKSEESQPVTEEEPSSSRQTRSSSSRLLPPSPLTTEADAPRKPPTKPPISGGPSSKTPTQETRSTRSSLSLPAVPPSESSTPESKSPSTKGSGFFSKKSPSPEGGSKTPARSWTTSPAKKAREKLSQAMGRLKGKSPSKTEQGVELSEMSSASDVRQSPSKRKPKPESIASKLSTPEKRRKESISGEQSGAEIPTSSSSVRSRTPELSVSEQCQASISEVATLPPSTSAPLIKISDTQRGARFLLPTPSSPSMSSDSRDELSIRSEARSPLPPGPASKMQVTPDFLADVLTNLAESLRKASPRQPADAEQDEEMNEFRQRGNGDFYLIESKEAQTDTKLQQFYNQMKRKIRSTARQVRRISRGESLHSAARRARSSRPPSREQEEAVDEPVRESDEKMSRGTQTVSLEVRDCRDRVLYCVSLSFRNLDLCFGMEEWSVDEEISSYSSSSTSDLRNVSTMLAVPGRSRSRSNSSSSADVSMETVSGDDDSQGPTDASKAGAASVAQMDIVVSEEDSRGSVEPSTSGASAAQQDVVGSEEDSRSSGVSSLASTTARLEVRRTRHSSRDKSKFDLP